ncbi:hypothetical protein Tco_0149669 [Tanacetum coccineum]
MAPKRTSTSAAPSMTQAAIKKLVADSVAAALEAQAATMANTNNTTRNTGHSGIWVMRPLALKQPRKPRSDHGMPKACHSVSSSFAHHYGSSSHHKDDDEDDDASRASTPSPTTYLNSLSPLNYQKYDIPTSSQQDDDLLFERQTSLLNQTQKLHEEVKGGFKSFGKALKGVFSKKKK